MINFLKQTRRFVNAKEPVCVVLGNESCDLDSAVSAISLAYFYQNAKTPKLQSSNYLPILNIPKRDYPLKTEVKYAFEENNINEELLTFKDELNEDFLRRNTFVLVDHHVSPWLNSSVAIYDHRPKDVTAVIPNNCELHLELVGSCATLIAEEFLNADMLDRPVNDILSLMRSTIILDTVNFSEIASRATQKDITICLSLEQALKKFNCIESRSKVFELLVKARTDVSGLSAAQLLRKDYKILTAAKNESIRIAVPGFPLPVQNYIMKRNADEAINDFAKEFNCTIVLLMGMYVQPDDNIVHRDFGIINIRDFNLYKSIRKCLLSTSKPELGIEPYNDCNFMNGSFYKQKNIKVTRKHLLPIIKSVIDQ